MWQRIITQLITHFFYSIKWMWGDPLHCISTFLLVAGIWTKVLNDSFCSSSPSELSESSDCTTKIWGDLTPWNTTSELSVDSLPGDAIVLVKRLCWEGGGGGDGGGVLDMFHSLLGANIATAIAASAMARVASSLEARSTSLARSCTFRLQASRISDKSAAEASTT